MKPEQVKQYVIGVLKGWFKNKKVLDGFSEDEDGTLLYKGQEIGGESTLTEAELQKMIDDTVAELESAINGEEAEAASLNLEDEEVPADEEEDAE